MDNEYIKKDELLEYLRRAEKWAKVDNVHISDEVRWKRMCEDISSMATFELTPITHTVVVWGKCQNCHQKIIPYDYVANWCKFKYCPRCGALIDDSVKEKSGFKR